MSDLPTAVRPPGRIEIQVDSHPANVAAVRRAVETFVIACGFDQPTSEQIGLCLNEAFANVIRHAYDGRTDRQVRIAVECVGDGVQLSLRDWGSGQVPPPPPPPDLRDPLLPGGLGTICLKELMDEVTYLPQDDGMLLTMLRRKPIASAPDRPEKPSDNT